MKEVKTMTNNIYTICYKTATPIVYNKGKVNQKSYDTFLQCELWNASKEEATATAQRMNDNNKDTNVTYFVAEQQAMNS
jgi:hypothetical protein